MSRTETLDALRMDVARLKGQYDGRDAAVTAMQRTVDTVAGQVQLLTLTESVLSTLLTTVSAESLTAIEQTITYGLQTVFDDQSLQFKFDISQSRGGQSVEPVLLQGKVEAPILSAFGGGPGVLVAFLLRLITCHRSGLYPIVLMDETFSMVSVEYVPNLAKLLRELSTRLGYTFVVVAHGHRQELIDGATHAYEIRSTPDGATFQKVT